jgi:S-adenosylmethionine uptake transporter
MRAKSSHSPTDAINGAYILVFGLSLFSIQDNIIKYFSDTSSVLQIVFIRGCIAMFLMLLCLALFRQSIRFVSRKPVWMLARGLLGFTSYTCFYLAVAAMPLAEVVAITFTMPLFVTAMSALILRERVGARRWGAVVIGFAGVLIILSPSGEFDLLAVVFSFIAAFTYASQTIITRFLSVHDNPMTIALNAIAIFTIASGLLSLMMFFEMITITSNHPSLAFFVRDWAMPGPFGLFLLVVIGFVGAIGFYCLSKAYCVSEASALAPYEFTYINWAVVFGYLIWDESPGPRTLLGIVILVSSGLYIWYRERQIDRDPAEDKHAVSGQLPSQGQLRSLAKAYDETGYGS